MPSKEVIQKVWEKGREVRGRNPNLWRRDAQGNPIYRPAYGTEGDKGWEVDHIKPKEKGGSDALPNLQPLQTEANRKKADKHRKRR